MYVQQDMQRKREYRVHYPLSTGRAELDSSLVSGIRELVHARIAP
jgi:hypothetical protein